MKFPKEAADDLQQLTGYATDHKEKYVPDVDPKDLDDLVAYAEFANARIQELEAQCGQLEFKIRCVIQALK